MTSRPPQIIPAMRPKLYTHVVHLMAAPPSIPRSGNVSLRQIRMPRGAEDLGTLRLKPPTKFGECRITRLKKNRMQTTPPALRKVGARETSEVLPVPGQGGYPPFMDTDASIGHSCLRHKSSVATLTARHVGAGVLARLMGRASRGRPGTKKLAHRAKVAYRPCCTAVTHVAAPPTLGSWHPRCS